MDVLTHFRSIDELTKTLSREQGLLTEMFEKRKLMKSAKSRENAMKNEYGFSRQQELFDQVVNVYAAEMRKPLAPKSLANGQECKA